MRSASLAARWLVFVFAASTSAIASFDNATTRCFVFSTPSPARTAGHADVDARWCYAERTGGGLLVFAAPDQGSTLDEKSSVYLSPGARAARTPDSFSPLGIPLDVEEAAAVASPDPQPLPEKWTADAERIFRRVSFTPTDRSAARIAEGTEEYNVPANKFPVNAYWWPFAELALASGPFSPLGKFDAQAEAWTGTNPNSVGWELQTHSLEHVEWGGHCNGWAASSLLYPHTNKIRWSPQTEKLIFPTDIHGIRAEASFCVQMAFYGLRYDGHPGQDIEDIAPGKFAEVLRYYIPRGRPVILDYVRDVSVDNHVIVGYKFVTKKAEDQPNAFDVDARLNIYGYAMKRFENDEMAPRLYNLDYRYRVVTDESGAIVSEKWTGGNNPDFFWLALAQRRCGNENPRIDTKILDRIERELPEAKTRKVDLAWKYEGDIEADQLIQVPVPKMPGGFYRVHVKNVPQQTGLYLVGTGMPLYPTRYQQAALPYAEFLAPMEGEQVIAFPVQELTELTLLNATNVPLKKVSLEISAVEFLGAPDSSDGRSSH